MSTTTEVLFFVFSGKNSGKYRKIKRRSSQSGYFRRYFYALIALGGAKMLVLIWSYFTPAKSDQNEMGGRFELKKENFDVKGTK